jgi:hypothetical protein
MYCIAMSIWAAFRWCIELAQLKMYTISTQVALEYTSDAAVFLLNLSMPILHSPSSIDLT